MSGYKLLRCELFGLSRQGLHQYSKTDKNSLILPHQGGKELIKQNWLLVTPIWQWYYQVLIYESE